MAEFISREELTRILKSVRTLRIPPVPPEDMYAEQRRAAEAVAARRKPSASSNGGLAGPYIPMVHVPGILDRFQYFGDYCRFYTGVPAKLRILAICITARHIKAEVEFYVHLIEAHEFGLAKEITDAIAEGRRPQKMDEEEEVVYDFCQAILKVGRVSDELFAKSEKLFGKTVTLELDRKSVV